MSWVRDNYGSRLGLIRFMALRAGWYFHPLSGRRFDLGEVERLVFVCKGNICRSPLAQRVAEDAGFSAVSYGYLTTPGKSADQRMQLVSDEMGHDLSSHRTTRLSDYRPEPGDLVLFFEPEHHFELSHLGFSAERAALLGSWAVPRCPYIHDPYGGSVAYYQKAAGVIRQSVLNLVALIGSSNAS